jgi:hypothetical protein
MQYEFSAPRAIFQPEKARGLKLLGLGGLREQNGLMNKHVLKPQLTPYETDYAQWCAEQGALLRSGRVDAVDRENLAEEIESLGRSDKREIRSRLKELLLHLLKWHFQPGKRKGGWRASIVEQRDELKQLLEESPSLRDLPSLALARSYRVARAKAADETGLAEAKFPDDCPYSVDDILDDDFFPGPP